MNLPGSQRSVQQLVEDHYAALYRYGYRLTGSAADAEDLTQETFCQAQLKFAQLRDPARAKAWLFSILRNAYLHRVRASKQEVARVGWVDGDGGFILLVRWKPCCTVRRCITGDLRFVRLHIDERRCVNQIGQRNR